MAKSDGMEQLRKILGVDEYASPTDERYRTINEWIKLLGANVGHSRMRLQLIAACKEGKAEKKYSTRSKRRVDVYRLLE